MRNDIRAYLERLAEYRALAASIGGEVYEKWVRKDEETVVVRLEVRK